MTRFVTSCFLPGSNAEETRRNFYQWLYQVYDEGRFPCEGKIKGVRTRLIVNGCFHHLNGVEALGFILVLQDKLAEWGAACITNNMTCGSVLLLSNSGKAQNSLTQQLVGPFLD